MYEDFTSTYGPFAQQIARQTGQDPNLVLGIIAQETGYGQHIAGNNVFGISPKGNVAGYPNIETAGKAYVDLMQQPRYSTVANAKGAEAQALALQLGGYNPDKNYGVKVGDRIRSLPKATTGPSDDELLQLRGGSTNAPTPSVGTTSAPATSKPSTSVPSDDELLQLRGPVSATSTASQTTTAQPETTAPPPGIVSRTISGILPGVQAGAAGFMQGAKQVIDPQAEFLARYLGDNMLTRGLGMPSSQDVTAADQARQQAYQQQYGDSTYANIGNVAGQGAAVLAETAPIRAAVAPLMTRLMVPGAVNVPGAISAAPGTGAAIQSYTTALSPFQQLAGRALGYGSNALQGGIGAALTGGSPVTGAIAGAAMGPASEGLNYLARTKMINKLLENPITRKLLDTAGILGGAHFGGPLGALLGRSAGEVTANTAPLANLLMRGAGGVPPSIAGAMAGSYPLQ